MSLTNFAALTDEQLTVWKRDTWRAARDNSFIGKFMGSGDGEDMIPRVTELKKDEKGARAVITLVTDLEGDGTVGDNFLEGNEEAMRSDDQVIQIDQHRFAIRHKGRMADQRSVVRFRENARNNLSYALSDRMDQLAFLTLSGISYAFNTDGSARTGSQLTQLDFAADVSAPTTNRHFRWDVDDGLVAGDTASVADGDLPSYDMITEIRAKARRTYLKPIRGEAGLEFYNVFMSPEGIKALKQDSDFKAAWRDAMPSRPDNPIFKSMNPIWLDGMAIFDYRHVYNTLGIADGSKWGAAGNTDGQRVLVCGAQALAMADIGLPYWDEKTFDYHNSPGLSFGKMYGLLKPKFYSIYTESTEDFGVICVDTALDKAAA